MRTTTRRPRVGVGPPEHHRFVTDKEFRELDSAGEVFFKRERYGHQYGFLLEDIIEALLSRNDIVMEHRESTREIKATWPGTKVRTVGIMPLHFEEKMTSQQKNEAQRLLVRRIRERDPRVSDQEASERSRAMLEELKDIKGEADYVLINEPGADLEELYRGLEDFALSGARLATTGPSLAPSAVPREETRGLAVQIPTFASSFVTRLFKEGMETLTASLMVVKSALTSTMSSLRRLTSSLKALTPSATFLKSLLRFSRSAATWFGVKSSGFFGTRQNISKNPGLVKRYAQGQNDVMGARLGKGEAASGARLAINISRQNTGKAK